MRGPPGTMIMLPVSDAGGSRFGKPKSGPRLTVRQQQSLLKGDVRRKGTRLADVLRQERALPHSADWRHHFDFMLQEKKCLWPAQH